MRYLRNIRDIRDSYEFTLSDAWGALPTLLAMAGFFLAGVIIVYVVKKFLEWFLLSIVKHQQPRKYVVTRCTTCPTDRSKSNLEWEVVPTHSYGSIVHIVLEILFVLCIIIVALFAAAVGNVNLWQSPLAVSTLAIIVTYILASGLQQVGSGFFFFLQNFMSYGEYWEQVGSGGKMGGFVSRITPFYVEFESHLNRVGVTIRVPMTTVLSSSWIRKYSEEFHGIHYAKDDPAAKGFESFATGSKDVVIKVSKDD